MIVTYDIFWADRELTVVLPDYYSNKRDEIYDLLDWAYDRWNHVSELEDDEDYLLIHDMCCEEYMVEMVLAANYDYISWDSEYYEEEL